MYLKSAKDNSLWPIICYAMLLMITYKKRSPIEFVFTFDDGCISLKFILQKCVAQCTKKLEYVVTSIYFISINLFYYDLTISYF